jgi:uncharacterized membrane protein (DUF106 family)
MIEEIKSRTLYQVIQIHLLLVLVFTMVMTPFYDYTLMDALTAYGVIILTSIIIYKIISGMRIAEYILKNMDELNKVYRSIEETEKEINELIKRDDKARGNR